MKTLLFTENVLFFKCCSEFVISFHLYIFTDVFRRKDLTKYVNKIQQSTSFANGQQSFPQFIDSGLYIVFYLTNFLQLNLPPSLKSFGGECTLLRVK